MYFSGDIITMENDSVQYVEAVLAHTPINRLGSAEDIAGVMLYFASPTSEWVSGQTIFLNGGVEQTLE